MKQILPLPFAKEIIKKKIFTETTVPVVVMFQNLTKEQSQLHILFH